MSHIPTAYIVPLSIIIAILITKTGNVYLYWSCITLCSLIIAIRHGEIIWEFGKTLVKSLYSYFRSYTNKWNGLYIRGVESNEIVQWRYQKIWKLFTIWVYHNKRNMMNEQQEATLRAKTILLLFNYPTQWKRIMNRFIRCISNGYRSTNEHNETI